LTAYIYGRGAASINAVGRRSSAYLAGGAPLRGFSFLCSPTAQAETGG
jgi:hypothetical protein